MTSIANGESGLSVRTKLNEVLTRDVASVSALLADTELTYSAGQPGVVVAGDVICTRAEGFSYQVAASGATDQHVTTAGGVKLYVLPSGEGYNVKAFGAVGDGVADDTAALQAALLLGGKTYAPAGTYMTTAPLYLDGGTVFLGAGRSETKILKSATTVGTGSNLARSGAVVDSYAKNAILICRHGDNTYNYETQIRGMTLEGAGYTIEYGIYAPRMSQWIVEDVEVFQCRFGIVAHDAWMVRLEGVTCDANTQRNLNGNNYGWSDANVTYGFYWQNDGSNSVTGTSVHASNCWARDCHVGWSIYALDYSTLSSSGADNISACAYFIQLSTVVMNGCGMENVQISNVGSGNAALRAEGSRITLNGCRALGVMGFASGTTAYVWCDGAGSRLVFNSCSFADFSAPNASFRYVIQDAGKMIINNSIMPTNGNFFVGFANGAQLIDNTTTPPSIQSAASNKAVRYVQGRVRDNEVIEGTSKSIASAGTVICTLTDASAGGGGVYMASVRLRVTWFDTAFPSGMGLSDVQVVVYRDGANYRQVINTSVNIGAGNSYTTAPTYTIGRIGDVWSVTMTPAHGDCTARTITAEVENQNSITVALP